MALEEEKLKNIEDKMGKIVSSKINKLIKSGIRISDMQMSADINYPYQKEVKSKITGKSKVLISKTLFELDEKIQNAVKELRNEEIKTLSLNYSQDPKQAVKMMTDDIIEYRKQFEYILSQSLEKDDRYDWEKYMIKDTYPEFIYSEEIKEDETQEKESNKSFFSKLFKLKKEDENKNSCNDNNSKINALKEYLIKKEEFEKKKRKNNSEILYLKKYFEQSEQSAVQKYAEMIIETSEYTVDIEADKHIRYNQYEKSLTVNFLFGSSKSFPIIKEFIFNDATLSFEEIMFSKKEIEEFYIHILYTVCVRTIHELFEAIYTNSVNTITFNGYVINENGDVNSIIFNSDIGQNSMVRCVFSVTAPREKFLLIDLTKQSVEKTLESLGINYVRFFNDNTHLMYAL